MDTELNSALEIILQGSRELGLAVPRRAAEKMIIHMTMLAKWRIKARLTSITRVKETALYHFLDSLTLLKVVPRGTSFSLLDVGSGGGFAGFVVVEAEPGVSLTVLDRDP